MNLARTERIPAQHLPPRFELVQSSGPSQLVHLAQRRPQLLFVARRQTLWIVVIAPPVRLRDECGTRIMASQRTDPTATA